MNRQERRRTKFDPDHHYWIGRDLLTKEDWSGAATAFLQATKLAPHHAPFYRAYGLAVARLDDFQNAIKAFQRTVALDPTLARGWSDLGVTMLKAGLGAEAIPHLERALAIEPELEQARTTLAVALATEGQTDRALEILDRAVANDKNPEVQYARGTAKLRQARIDEALTALRNAIELDPDHMLAYHNLLFTLQHHTGVTAESLYAEHVVWGTEQRRLRPPADHPGGGSPDPERRPVIGLVSGDLRRHAVGLLTIRAIEGLARRGYRIICFANQAETDDLSQRFKKAAAKWHQVNLMSDPDHAALVRREKIDILIDLTGHTARHRLGVFSLRSAPIQGSWAGYVGTTGLEEMDFLVADAVEVPEGEDRWYIERVLRMPRCYVTYEPPPVDRPITTPPSLGDGVITFGCFNRPAKLNDGVFILWERLLARVPRSRLLIKYAGVDTGQTHEILVGMARRAGIADDRIIYEPGTTSYDMQEAYERVDVALDTFPYSGGITTLEALWMGVPVVTLRGATFAGRHSASHLTAIGLSELIADDGDGYVERAASLALDQARLIEIRAGLREMVRRSPLADGDQFAAGMDEAFQALWREYCTRRRAAKQAMIS